MRMRIRHAWQDVTIGNEWVVPHNKYLLILRSIQAHANVELCMSVKSIKYVLKYVHKGNDAAAFALQNSQDNNRDEITMYQEGRYVSSSEACWRILDFPIHERYPSVTALACHLENGQRVYFTSRNALDHAADPPRTTLIAFFDLCKIDEFAASILYIDVPKYYTCMATK